MSAKITAYKGFDKDLKCREFQYKVGDTYEHDGDIQACCSGFHACENPFDVWSYYSINGSRFCAVTLSGNTDTDSSDSKIAAEKITIEAEIKTPDFIKTCIDWMLDLTKYKDESGYDVQIGSSGDNARIGSSGDYAQIGSSGDYAQIVSEGECSVIASSGISATFKAQLGTWVSIAEFNDRYKCIGFVTGRVGDNGIKPDTLYKAQGGKFVEVE